MSQFNVTREGHVAHLEFNRPRQINAFAKDTWTEYRQLLRGLDADPDVKAIVISGAGRHFTAGLDLKDAVASMGAFRGSKRDFYDYIKDFQDAISTPATISTPTIVLIHGICYGLGVDILSTATIRVASKDARMSIKEIQVGLPADMGSLQRFPRLVGSKSLANRLALTGEDFGWETAVKLGLVDDADVRDTKEQGLQRCFELARCIAQWQGWCIRGTKLCLSEASESAGSVADGLETIAQYNRDNMDPVRFGEGLRKLFAKL